MLFFRNDFVHILKFRYFFSFFNWQTCDLLRIMAYGMLDFCEWFTAAFPKHHGYYLVPLRTNGSALESIFSCLNYKFRAGGNLSGAKYGQILGRVIKKRELDHNPNTERSYRGINLNISGSGNASTNLPATLASRTTTYPEICAIRHLFLLSISFRHKYVRAVWVTEMEAMHVHLFVFLLVRL